MFNLSMIFLISILNVWTKKCQTFDVLFIFLSCLTDTLKPLDI